MNGYGQQYGRALATARRRARLSGRKLSPEVTAGITRGFAESASGRLVRAKGIELQERGLTQRKELHGETLAAQKGMQAAGFEHAAGMQATQLAQMKSQFEAGQTLTREQMAISKTQWEKTYGLELTAEERAKWKFSRKKTTDPAAICIIITACTSPESYEVEIAREYRDTILDDITLGGYYVLCQIVVPLIHKSRLFKRFIKKFLVDRLIDHAEAVLNYKNQSELMTSNIVTKGFLRFCHLIGLHK